MVKQATKTPNIAEQQALPTDNRLFEGLNQQQLTAVKHAEGPLLIVAGAGTGKTTVITRRIAYLLETGAARPDEIAALTFTEKAAGEMQERVDLLLPIGAYDTWIATFHGFCERILKMHALDIGIPNDFTLLDSTRQWILVYKNLSKFKLSYYRPLGNPAKFIDAMLSHFSRCKDELIGPEDYLSFAEGLRLQTDQPAQTKINPPSKRRHSESRVHPSGEESRVSKKDPSVSDALNVRMTPVDVDPVEIARIEELAGAYHTYQKLLIDHNYLDFADLINYTLALFKKRPKILKYYQDKFKYILVDEFQDTNYAQYELVKLLAGVRQNLTVVGDDDQSIYKFRGASVSNILKLKEDFPELSEITLVENYRSSQNILDLAYDFIQKNNPDRLETKLDLSKKLHANIPQEGVIEVLEAQDLSSELNCVANKIMELKNSEPSCSWNDFAILLRRNASADELLPVLGSRNIPYTFVANRGLYKKQIIVDILSYLRLLDNFHDSHSLYRVLTLPKFFIPHDERAHILAHGHKKALTLYEALKDAKSFPETSDESRKSIERLINCLHAHSDAARRIHAAELFVSIVKDIGIEEVISEDTLENAENRELVDQFYKKIEEFGQEETDRSMHNFLATLDLELEAGNEGEIKFDPNAGPESVKVMTVHSSKGLEFNYVFVISMVDQRFPTREKSDPIEIPEALIKDILPEGDFHLQEERRLFYVAMTRAKTYLYLTWAKDYGGSRAKKPSSFLVETGLVPSDRVNQATGKVMFRPAAQPGKQIYVPSLKYSYSQLNDFETCPLKYKYHHYLKLPVAGSCHLSFGQTIHKVFEEYLKLYKTNLDLPQQDLFGGKPEVVLPPAKFLEELYEKHWVDDWYDTKEQKEEYRVLGRKMLGTFYETSLQAKFVPKYIEKFFQLKLGEYLFTGKIDRADSVQNGIILLDYKTGQTPKKSKDLDQLYIYQWAAEEYLKETVVGLKYWYLQDNTFIEEEIAPEKEITDLKQRLLELVERIAYTTKYDLFKEEHKKARDHRCEFEYLE